MTPASVCFYHVVRRYGLPDSPVPRPSQSVHYHPPRRHPSASSATTSLPSFEIAMQTDWPSSSSSPTARRPAAGASASTSRSRTGWSQNSTRPPHHRPRLKPPTISTGSSSPSMPTASELSPGIPCPPSVSCRLGVDLCTILCAHHHRNVENDNTISLHGSPLPTAAVATDQSGWRQPTSMYRSGLTAPSTSSIPAPAKSRSAICPLDP